MKVSIIVPVHMQEVEEIEWLNKALDSVVEQTYQDIEIVVVNDNSPRRLTWPKRKHKQKNIVWVEIAPEKHGVSAARNYGVFHSTGDLILPLDHDDYLEKDAVQWMVESYQSHDGGVVYGDLMLFGNDSEKLWKCQEGCNALLKDVVMWNSSLFSKADWAKVGGWNEKLQFLEDWDLNVKFVEHEICAHHLTKVVAWYRQRPDSRMAKLKADPNGWTRAYAELRANHADFFNGRLKSMCCGSQVPAQAPAQNNTKKATVEGDRTLIKYVGNRRASFFVTGPQTGIRYNAPGAGQYLMTTDSKVGVDPRDASGFVKMNGGHDFIQV